MLDALGQPVGDPRPGGGQVIDFDANMAQAEPDRSLPPLRIGLVNNMPDAALAVTERQFRDLVQAAAPGRTIELRLFEIPGIPRSPVIRSRMEGRYRPIEALDEAALDALVVTGADPGSKPLREAEFWPGFEQLTDWAVARNRPTLWSCLAAHAAVEHLDGISRRRLPAKLSGVYAFTAEPDDPLTAGLGGGWTLPHSRYNGLDEAELAGRGYRILSRSEAVGVDVFASQGPPLFLFFQGHPEYDHDSLALEFRRDFRAFVREERDSLPDVPIKLYSPEVAQALEALREEAVRRPSPGLLSRWPADAGLDGPPPWRATAIRLCANWLAASANPAGLEPVPFRWNHLNG